MTIRIIFLLAFSLLTVVYANAQTPANTQTPQTPQQANIPAVPSLDQARNGLNASGQPVEGAKALPPVSATPDQYFEAAKNAKFPFTPEQIKLLQTAADQQKRAARANIDTVPIVSTLPVDLSPSAKPLVVRAYAFLGATINFVDALGNPWPIKTVRNYNPEDFNIVIPFAGSNSIGIDNKGTYGEGGAAIWLEGLDMPLPVVIFGGQKETDLSRTYQLPRKSPGAAEPVPASIPAAANVDRRLNDLLEGIIPAGAVTLHTSDELVRAWQVDDFLVIRTTLSLMSNFRDRVPAPDGTVVYSMAMTPQITVSVAGQTHQVTIEF